MKSVYFCITWKFANYFVMETLSLLILFHDAFANAQIFGNVLFSVTTANTQTSPTVVRLNLFIVQSTQFAIILDFLSHSHTFIYAYGFIFVCGSMFPMQMQSMGNLVNMHVIRAYFPSLNGMEMKCNSKVCDIRLIWFCRCIWVRINLLLLQ